MTINANPMPPKHVPRFRIELPQALAVIVNAGIVSTDGNIRRRQRFANIASYALALDALTHLVVNSVHDFQALLPVNIYNIIAGIAYFSMHRLHRYGENVMANVLLAFALVGHSYVVFAFGLNSNLHVYFTMAGVILFFIGVEHWRNFLALYACSFLALIAAMLFAPENGFVMIGDAAFRDQLALQAMISAFVLNAAVIAFVLVALDHAEKRLQQEYDRAELLLTSILPETIADRLKKQPARRIADRLENATVLFMDLVGFTPVAAKAPPEEVVDYLHRLFSRLDALCEEYGVDKIKTIGDSYMAVGGLRGDADESAVSVGMLALAMREVVSGERLGGETLGFRIGIHSGPVVAGVIGDRRLAYDVWGDTVNVASRLESSSVAQQIQVSEQFRQLVVDRFNFEMLGDVELKGAGRHRVYVMSASHGEAAG